MENREHAKRLNDRPFTEEIKPNINEAGASVLADGWLASGFASKTYCILAAGSRQGQVTLAAPAHFEPRRGRSETGNGEQMRASQKAANAFLREYLAPVLGDAAARAVLRSTTTDQ